MRPRILAISLGLLAVAACIGWGYSRRDHAHPHRTPSESEPARQDPTAISVAQWPASAVLPSSSRIDPQPAQPKDPIARMEQRLERRRDRQLAGLRQVCEVDDAGLVEARRILDEFSRTLVDLAGDGREGRITQAEFSKLEREVVAKKGAAWCRLLVQGGWGPQACRDIAAQCEKQGAVSVN